MISSNKAFKQVTQYRFFAKPSPKDPSTYMPPPPFNCLALARGVGGEETRSRGELVERRLGLEESRWRGELVEMRVGVENSGGGRYFRVRGGGQTNL